MKTSQKAHFAKLSNYYRSSSYGYEMLLWGYQHFGYHPLNRKIPEKEAVKLMQDKIAEKLRLSKNMTILDAGCARGLTAVYFAKKYKCNVHGIDVLGFLLEKAGKNAVRAKVTDKTTFQKMDYSELYFKDGYFDAVYTMETLCHSTDLRKTLKEFHRVLNKRGRIALLEYSIADDREISDYEAKLLDEMIESTATGSLRSMRHKSFEKLIREAGFKRIRKEDISKNVMPSLKRFRNLAFIPYNIIKPLRLQHHFPNLTIAIEWTKGVENGIIRHNIFTAEK